MGSGDPLKNEMILLVAVRNRSHKVEDTGFAEMGFGFLHREVPTQEYSALLFIGKDVQL